MAPISREQNPELWERLERVWVEEKKPGRITVRGQMFKVLLPTDEPVFLPVASTLDDNYSSVSTGGLVK